MKYLTEYSANFAFVKFCGLQRQITDNFLLDSEWKESRLLFKQ